MEIPDSLKLDRSGFGQDPFGYSALANLKFGMASTYSGSHVDITKPATGSDLKNPVLWLTQTQALTEAAIAVFRNEPSFENMPVLMRGVCDSQYCAVGLMLVGYSLEVSLKAMLIIKYGIKGYKEIERKNKHHRLHDLAKFIPELTKKDIAILRGLTHYVYWAGRYPDPGTGEEDKVEDIFNISESYRISAKELFELSAKVSGHARKAIEEV
ncbi:TPA: hypothetical protein MEA99_002526 [Klebsiella aerogenes]|nr:hypothetical protein [Klebsiella aerogenes]